MKTLGGTTDKEIFVSKKYAVCGPSPFVEPVMSVLRSNPELRVTTFANASELSSLDSDTNVVIVVGDEVSCQAGIVALKANVPNLSVLPRLDYAKSLPDDRRVLVTHQQRVGLIKCLKTSGS